MTHSLIHDYGTTECLARGVYAKMVLLLATMLTGKERNLTEVRLWDKSTGGSARTCPNRRNFNGGPVLLRRIQFSPCGESWRRAVPTSCSSFGIETSGRRVSQ